MDAMVVGHRIEQSDKSVWLMGWCDSLSSQSNIGVLHIKTEGVGRDDDLTFTKGVKLIM